MAQPRATFDGKDLYTTLSNKVASLGYALIQNHAFGDGNKRVGHAAMELMLLHNGYEFTAEIDESERAILGVASGQISQEELAAWIEHHIRQTQG